MKFIEETCERCGTCLLECPYIDITPQNAKDAITHRIETKTESELSKDCFGCGYCDKICPTKSNPSELAREINLKKINKQGIPRFFIISKENPSNYTSLALQFGPDTKKQDIKEYLNPPNSEKMFYLGCGLSYVQTDLIKTKLLDGLPKIGGDKYCCGGIVTMFGDEEAKIKGKSLLNEFKELGVKKFIMFCPGCLGVMKGIYAKLLPEFQNSIEFQTFSQYIIEKYHQDEIKFTNKINQRITFHDPCAWMDLDQGVFEAPRELLEILGAEVVEMKHNQKTALCCGSPFSDTNKELYKKVTGIRVDEALEVEADMIAVSCTGCLRLAKPAKERNIETYHMLELTQIAVGEKPPHRTIEIREKFDKLIEKALSENPDLLKDKVIIKNGKIQRI
ncbi:MAG: (Fe-S)-binding protein [Promethearchaeota archaeon]